MRYYPAILISTVLDEMNIDGDWQTDFLGRLATASAEISEAPIVDPEARAQLITLLELSEILDVAYGTAMRWPQRRGSTGAMSGFPEPVGRTLSKGRGRHAYAFVRSEVRAWVLTKRGVDIGE